MREEDRILLDLLKTKQWKVIIDRINRRIKRNEYISRGERNALAYAKEMLRRENEKK
jgi:hypothetical protein